MKLMSKNIVWLLFLIYTCANAQVDQQKYKREITGVSSQWHKLTLPDEIYGKASPNLSEIRILGISSNKDTIEAPYILRHMADKTLKNNVAFKIVNTSVNKKAYYFTFEIPAIETINQMELDFQQKNFDWRLQLEGSQNQKQWFTLLNDYRIVSIKNDLTDYQFTKLSFPNAKYRFFRVKIKGSEKPHLIDALISENIVSNGIFRSYPNKKIKIIENKKNKQTVINIDLLKKVSIDNINISIQDTFDYYRPITIKYLADSVETEQGWKYSYNILSASTINSLEKNEYKFDNQIARKLKVIIDNRDNQPLHIGKIEVQGFVNELAVRFTKPATYFLFYGNKQLRKPEYDINRFVREIPKNLTEVKLGKEQIVKNKAISKKSPLFKNKNILWGIMVLIIFILGWFSLKMIRKN